MDYSEVRDRLIWSLQKEVADTRVLHAMASVPREEFVPAELAAHAYDDAALPIGEGQTISQPLIVAVMLEALGTRPTDVVLDVGTGSGYQAAVLSRLVSRVVSVERVPPLADRAAETLGRLGYTNVELRIAHDVLGWPEGAPYNGIVVAAAAPSVPNSLIEQLGPEGTLVMPVGTPFQQDLVRVTRRGQANEVTWLGPCRFVHLIGAEGWPDDEIPPEPAD